MSNEIPKQTTVEVQTKYVDYIDPFNPTRLEVLRAVERRNNQRWGARFSLSEIIQEANAAVLDGDLVWRDDRSGGRWLTEKGKAKIL